MQILKIARRIVNSTNTSKAVKTLKKLLRADTQWHNEQKFPENESNALAFKTCVDVNSAKKFCPVRYASLKKWIAACREIMALIHPQFINAFHVTGISKKRKTYFVTMHEQNETNIVSSLRKPPILIILSSMSVSISHTISFFITCFISCSACRSSCSIVLP